MTKIWLSNTPPPRQNNHLKSISYSELTHTSVSNNSEHPTHVILNLIQDLNRDAECPQHDGIGSESGRSMVEMLGVLAVMGLLTIIGIAGFKIAMNKAKANNLVADMNRLAHVVVMNKFSGYSEEAIARSVAEHNKNTEYQAEYEYRTPQVFAIKIKNAIDKALCQQVASLGWKLPIAMHLNGTKIEGDFTDEKCTDSNQLAWFFTNDLSACPDCPLSLFDCTPYGNECGTCDDTKGYTETAGACANSGNGSFCIMGRCVQCNDRQFYRNGCLACNSTGNYYPNSIEATKYNCLGEMFWADMMYGCNNQGTAPSNADAYSCKKCANRCFHSNFCYFTGADGFIKRNDDGTCLATQQNGQTVFSCQGRYIYRGKCLPCNNFNNYYDGLVSPLDKHNCPNEMFWAGSYMYGCMYSSNPSNADEISCKACTNRCYKDGTCYLAGAGQAHQRVSDTDGTCAN